MKIKSKMSKQPRKQRKYWIYDAPWHRRRKLMVTALTKEAQMRYGVKRMPVRVGDRVIVVKGKYKGIIGKVIDVDTERFFVYIDTVTRRRNDGRIVHVPIRVWNVRIVELDLSDETRREILERKRKIAQVATQQTQSSQQAAQSTEQGS